MRVPVLLVAIPLLLAVSGCCGGYSVVRTTVASGADLPSGDATDVPRGSAFVLHYSRFGEPPNACGSGMQYVERLWVKVPSIAPGQTHMIGHGGVVAVYSREEGGAVSRARAIEGSIRINEVEGAEVHATVVIGITLPTGEVIALDDDYDFHPARAGQGG
jgi:hypothetical protein